MELNQDYTQDVESRLNWVIYIIGLFFLIVVFRLAYLQILKGNHYRIFSENNSIKHVTLAAPRGAIFDRSGNLVASNRAAFDLSVIPQYVSDREAVARSLIDILGLDPEVVKKKMDDAFKGVSYRPYTIVENVDLDVVSKIRSRKSPFSKSASYDLDGVDISYKYSRDYPDPVAASHILGYIREIDNERLEKLNSKHGGQYNKGDVVGVGGIEETYDDKIRGVDGVRDVVVNALGQEVVSTRGIELQERSPMAGGDAYLTIDMELQKVAKELIGENSGSAVAMDPKTGAILLMYSAPSYDLSRLHDKDKSKYWRDIILDPKKPLINRAIQGTYPPASTYKIITAMAGLESRVVDKDSTVTCTGGLRFGDRVFKCWKAGGHGAVNVLAAMAGSCDVYFYTVGIRAGIDKIAEYAKLFGLGTKTGVELPSEKNGLVPTTTWKEENRGAKWSEGETLSAAIGQGYNLTTPLQMAVVISEVANDGYKIKPHFVQKIVSSSGEELYTFPAEALVKIEGMSPDNLALVKEGLIRVVNGPAGTAEKLKVLNLKIAGKTGTAQVVGHESGLNAKTHAWFVGFAPYDDPKIAVAVIVEGGGGGSATAAPIVGEIIKKYLGEKNDKSSE